MILTCRHFLDFIAFSVPGVVQFVKLRPWFYPLHHSKPRASVFLESISPTGRGLGSSVFLLSLISSTFRTNIFYGNHATPQFAWTWWLDSVIRQDFLLVSLSGNQWTGQIKEPRSNDAWLEPRSFLRWSSMPFWSVFFIYFWSVWNMVIYFSVIRSLLTTFLVDTIVACLKMNHISALRWMPIVPV